MELDESFGQPHILLGMIYKRKGQWDKALEKFELAVSLHPIPLNMYHLAHYLRTAGRHEESIALFEKAFRLDPIPPVLYIVRSGMSYFMAEHYEVALAQFQRALERKSEFNPLAIHRGLAATYAMLGREEEARNHVAHLLKINSRYSLKRAAELYKRAYKNQVDSDRLVNALRKAGLPE
jgi:tetratricopeptide (TPR) repeat protein